MGKYGEVKKVKVLMDCIRMIHHWVELGFQYKARP
jgi:hypothetical protein